MASPTSGEYTIGTDYMFAMALNSSSSIVVEHVRATYEEDLRKIIAFWFFDSPAAGTDNLERMLRSLINQLMPVPEPIPAFVASFRKDHHNTQSLPTLEKLIILLLQVVCNLKRDIFIVIDGLDQCGYTDSVVRELLLKLSSDSIGDGHENVHRLVSSKWDDDLDSSLSKLDGQLSIIDIKENNEKDIDDFIVFKLSRDVWPRVASSTTRDQVMKTLRSKRPKYITHLLVHANTYCF